MSKLSIKVSKTNLYSGSSLISILIVVKKINLHSDKVKLPKLTLQENVKEVVSKNEPISLTKYVPHLRNQWVVQIALITMFYNI